MMSQQPEGQAPFDPFSVWRNMRDANMDAWAKMMVDFVNSEAYSQATAKWLDTYLTVSQPFQKAVEQTMTRVLTQLNMPTRTDVIGLAERLTNIELRLDDLDAKLDEVRRALARQQAAPARQATTPGRGAAKTPTTDTVAKE